METAFSIGQLARLLGLSVTTLRFWERKGLLPPPPRRASGYRVYDAQTLRRVRFIMEAKELGYSLHEIAELLALRADAGDACKNTRERTVLKITDLNEKIRQLKRYKRALEQLIAQCDVGDTQGECPILALLDHPVTSQDLATGKFETE